MLVFFLCNNGLVNFILHTRPENPPISWNDFLKSAPPNSIALDGYVSGPPCFQVSEEGFYANFNHHEDVPRLETRATCAQVLVSIRQGLHHQFEGIKEVNIFVNDCDEDVSLSVFLLRNYEIAFSSENMLLNRLVFMEDMLDTTAGTYSFSPDLSSLKKLMWVFEPYHSFRIDGGLESRDAENFTKVIDSVDKRIRAYIEDRAKETDLDTGFEILEEHKGWVLLKEVGRNARIGISNAGIIAFVSVRERADQSWDYTLSRASQFVPFPIERLVEDLNSVEDCKDGDMWGGGDLVSGSPRISGSKIPPEQASSIINKVLHKG